MKEENKKKLGTYTVMAGAVLGANAVNAQINYVDIQDVTVDTDSAHFDLDLNQDGDPDFRISQYLDFGNTGLLDAILVTPFDSVYGRTAGEVQNTYNYPYNMMPGDSIGDDTNWLGNGETAPGFLVFQYDGTPYPNSNWKGPVTGGFLGLRILEDDGLHYGWLRLDVASDNRSFTVKDFAYNTTAEEALQAGEPTLSQLESILEDLTIGQHASELIFMKPESFDQVSVKILDVNGQALESFTWSDAEERVSMAQHPHGMYIVEFEINGIRNARKVVLGQ